MKQKKIEVNLKSELEKVQQLATQGESLKQAEKRMNQLIQRALQYFKDELNPNMAQYYYEYGNILLSILEERDNPNYSPRMNPVSISEAQFVNLNNDNQLQNDQELRDAQVSWENLEASRQIIQVQLHKLKAEYEELQQRMIKIRESQQVWSAQQSKNLKRIADLHSWKEDYQDAIDTYKQVLVLIQSNNKVPSQKELAEIHYKLGNVLLLQSQPDCEQHALKHLQQSFTICVQVQQLQLGEYDLNSLPSVQQVREKLKDKEKDDQLLLLVLLLEKIEDTLSQLQEQQMCKIEIERWKRNSFKLDGNQEQPQERQSTVFDFNKLSQLIEQDSLSNLLPQSKKVKYLGVFGSAKSGSKMPEVENQYEKIIKKIKN